MPHGPDQGDAFVELLQTSAHRRERNAVCLSFFGMPSTAQPQDEPPRGDLVQRGSHLRQESRVPVVHTKHQVAYMNAIGQRGNCGDLGPAFEQRIRRVRNAE